MTAPVVYSRNRVFQPNRQKAHTGFEPVLPP
jgi:hypothetical protein